MLYFTVSYPTPDGDVIKATYMLTAVLRGRLPSVSRPTTGDQHRFAPILVAILAAAGLS